jgi:hypothetical protein
MKKLLIASLVLVMVVVFSGEASAQSWWESAQITRPITLAKTKTLKNGNTVLVTKSGTFTGTVVGETTTAVQGTSIMQAFACGALTVGSKSINVEIYFPNFSWLYSDTYKEPGTGKKDYENGCLIGIGQFFNQTDLYDGVNPAWGWVNLNGKLKLAEDSADDITSLNVNATAVGGYDQSMATYGYNGVFSLPFIAKLKPYTFITPGATYLTCVSGVVTEK